MPDVTCKRCGEPWDLHTVRNEAFEGDPYWEKPDNMPPELAELYDSWMETDPWCKTEEEDAARDELFSALYDTGLAKGCMACWADPELVADEDQRMNILQEAMFNDAWDGDPIALLDGMF